MFKHPLVLPIIPSPVNKLESKRKAYDFNHLPGVNVNINANHNPLIVIKGIESEA